MVRASMPGPHRRCRPLSEYMRIANNLLAGPSSSNWADEVEETYGTFIRNSTISHIFFYCRHLGKTSFTNAQLTLQMQEPSLFPQPTATVDSQAMVVVLVAVTVVAPTASIVVPAATATQVRLFAPRMATARCNSRGFDLTDFF